jgi:hypothetical protein
VRGEQPDARARSYCAMRWAVISVTGVLSPNSIRNRVRVRASSSTDRLPLARLKSTYSSASVANVIVADAASVAALCFSVSSRPKTRVARAFSASSRLHAES